MVIVWEKLEKNILHHIMRTKFEVKLQHWSRQKTLAHIMRQIKLSHISLVRRFYNHTDYYYYSLISCYNQFFLPERTSTTIRWRFEQIILRPVGFSRLKHLLVWVTYYIVNKSPRLKRQIELFGLSDCRELFCFPFLCRCVNKHK